MADASARLAEFDAARLEFEESIRRAPDAALRFKPAGEDYALGGLVVHVSQVLRKYARVVDAIRAAEWQAVSEARVSDPAEETALVREGFDAPSRVAVLNEMRAAHAALVDAIKLTAPEAFERTAAVTYTGSREPYPTSPADVLGWCLDHYKEHIQQVGELIEAWSAATR